MHAVAITIADPLQRDGLPLAEAFAGIDAQHVRTGLDQRRHTLFIVAGVDTGTDDIALIPVQQFIGMFLMGIVIFTEDECLQALFLIDDRQLIQLVLPDQIVGL